MDKNRNEIKIEEQTPIPAEPEWSPEVPDVTSPDEAHEAREEILKAPPEESAEIELPEKPVEIEFPEEPLVEAQQPPPEKPEKKPPSKTQKFFRKAFIWLMVVVLTFGAGLLLDHFLRYLPLKEDLDHAQSTMVELRGDIDELDGMVGQLRPKLEAANAKISSLEEDLEIANARSGLYQVLVDVSNARLALSLENVDEAQSFLEETPKRLEELEPVIQKVDPELALSLPRRLRLIIDGLQRDPETAAIDLGLLTKDILTLEAKLLKE